MNMLISKPVVLAGLLLAALVASGGATAQPPPAAQPQGVLNLTATATVEMANDLLSVTFSTTRQDTEAATVQAALKQALEAALAQARAVASPGQLDVQAGNFSLYPRHGEQGAVTGWQGSAEFVVEGRDMAAIAQLTGKVGTMTIARVGYSLSREAREKVEAEVTAQAIARFRARADEVSRQFGYRGHTIRDVSVSTDEPGGIVRPMMRVQAMSAEAALPVEAGKGSVTATVSGAVQMQ
jgi:predicted secreted protein